MKKMKALYTIYREIINYCIFGGGTTLVSWGTYALFVGALGMGIMTGKIISWVCAVAFAFVTNKLWVFFSKSWKAEIVFREAGEFLGSRIATGIVEVAGLPLLMKIGLDQSLFGVDGFVANIVVTIIVVILNYIISKFLVFRKKDGNEDKKEI